MTQEQEIKLYSYLDTLQSPLEQHFLTEKQKQEISKSKAKLESSRTFVSSIINQEEFEELIQKAVTEGRILSPSQAAALNEMFSILEDHDGVRMDIQESLVNKTGQVVIMSGRLVDVLGVLGDSYILDEEIEDLVSAMQADGVPGPEIDKVVAASNKYGVIVLQRGIFVGLKNLLEEAVDKHIANYVPRAVNVEPVQAVPKPQLKVAEEMPSGFIEYLKNNDKEFDHVENEVMNDTNFITFFNNLKSHYDYYKRLPADHMAHEIILRPVLWSKLLPPTQASVQAVVERHRAYFQNIVKQVATVSGISKLEALKKNQPQ